MAKQKDPKQIKPTLDHISLVRYLMDTEPHLIVAALLQTQTDPPPGKAVEVLRLLSEALSE